MSCIYFVAASTADELRVFMLVDKQGNMLLRAKDQEDRDNWVFTLMNLKHEVQEKQKTRATNLSNLSASSKSLTDLYHSV